MSLKKNSPKKRRKEKAKWDIKSPDDFKKREKYLERKLDDSERDTIKGNIYITAGKVKGFSLDIPTGTRPITSRVRKSIFDLLREDIINKKILDLYGGTGSFGFEALSRGAKEVTFVDTDKIAEQVLTESAAKTGFVDQVTIIRQEVDDYLRSANADDEEFDIIFIDPPYKLYNQKDPIKIESVLMDSRKLLPGIKEKIKINKRGIPEKFPGAIILKHPSRYDLSILELEDIKLLDTKEFGNNSISFYVVEKLAK